MHTYKPHSVAVFIDMDLIKLPITSAESLIVSKVIKLALLNFYLPKSDTEYPDTVFSNAAANAINCSCGYITPRQLSESPLTLVNPNKINIYDLSKAHLVKIINQSANKHLFHNSALELTQEDITYTQKSVSVLRNLYDIITEWPVTSVPYLSAAILRLSLVKEKTNLSFYVYLNRLLSIYGNFCNMNVLIKNPGPKKCPGYSGITKPIKIEVCAECYNFRNLYVSKQYNRVSVCNDPFLDDVIYTCDTKTRKFLTTYLTISEKGGVTYYPEIVLNVNRVLSYSIKMNSTDPKKYSIETNQILIRGGRREVKFMGVKSQPISTCTAHNPCVFCA